MAFKLTKAEETELEKLKTTLTDAYSGLEISVNDYNEKVEEVKDAVDSALATYNAALAEFRSFVEGVATSRRDEYDEKSDGWKEGDNGSTAEEWISTWEGADLEDAEIKYPDQLELEFDNHADTDLPGEP
jgi:hypothetical protein